MMAGNVAGVGRAPRLGYLDWLRGFAVLVMIQSHVFDAFMRPDLHDGAPYVLSQFVGGMAAPLFLFIAGIMIGFRIDSRAQAGASPSARFQDVLKRAAFIMLIAELMLLQQWVFIWKLSAWPHLLRADILNCMAVAIAVSAVIGLSRREKFAGAAIVLGSVIAAVAPLTSEVDWTWAPAFLKDYIVPAHGHFAFFPEAAYVPFGAAAGFAIRRAGEQHIDAVMKWMALVGFGLLYGGEFFSNQPYSLYAHVDFWINSPGLIVIRTGIMALAVACAFVWMRFGLLVELVRQLGTTSLLVYWVHVELVYGSWLRFLKKRLTGWEAALATIAITIFMYLLSLAKTRYWPRAKRAFSGPRTAEASRAAVRKQATAPGSIL